MQGDALHQDHTKIEKREVSRNWTENSFNPISINLWYLGLFYDIVYIVKLWAFFYLLLLLICASLFLK